MREKKSGKLMLLKKADLLLFFAVLITGAGVLLVRHLSLDRGGRVEVSVDGEVVLSAALDEELDEEISSPFGSNTLVIEQGRAYIKEADCKDKICVRHKPVSEVSETIICLPHKLVVEVVK